MIENYIKEADRVTYLMPKEVDHHCAGQIIAELDALIAVSYTHLTLPTKRIV